MILIISHPGDGHTRAVQAELAGLGVPAVLLDLSTFPRAARLSLRYAPGEPPVLLTDAEGRVHDLGACTAAWWRRPQPFGLDPALTDPVHHEFAMGELHECVQGLWQRLGCLWINHPSRDAVAGRKAWQLQVAREVGLEIPGTLITNDPEAARAFIAARGPGRTIFKSFSATHQAWRETRILSEVELALLDNVRFAPVIFQDYIEAEADLRVTVVGQEIFPAAIFSQETAYKVDFRMDMARARTEATDLPADVAAKLLALMDRLGIVYGAIDLRRTPEGRHVFLEVNPAGQWLFIEERTGQKITAALAGLLARGRSEPPPARRGRARGRARAFSS